MSKDDWNSLLSRLIQRTCALFGFLWLAFLLSSTQAQSVSTTRAAEIKRALQRADFQTAAELADSAIAHFREYLPAQLAEIHSFRALVFFEQGNSERAEEHLALALQLDPDLQLDPIFFSPQMQQRLEELRPKIVTLNPAAAPTTRYIVVADPRIAATWRSLLLPGWGQRFKGQKNKGRIFSITVAALAGATLTGHLLRSHAEKEYLRASENDVVAKYDTFNRYHQLRNNLALSLGVVWSAAVLDAFIVRAEPASNKIGAVFFPASMAGTARFAVQVSF
jgi:tetratricopeptide (TPR) repeat protein